ncbi:MAG: hypothetical protein WED00_07800 [Aquisalimonadaceae bacterium]
MQRHVVFLVHGMGVHPKGWSNAGWKLLNDAYDSLERSHLWPWDEGFERVEIRFDDCFEQLRDQWKSETGKVLDMLSGGGLQKSAVNRLVDITDRLGKNDFVTTHILDVLLYRFVDTVREAVKVKVGREITNKLSELPTGAPWSIISHSLGTAVSHDTLHALAVAGGSSTSAVRPAQLFVTLANVSRALQTDVKAYRSRVRPALPGQPGALRHFLDVHHTSDPFPAFWPFEPHDAWPDPATRSADRFREISLTAFSQTNVHAFEHYLRDPACHVPIFRALTMPELASAEEETSLRSAFLAQYPQHAFDAARRRLEKIFRKKTGNTRDLVELLRGLHEETRDD